MATETTLSIETEDKDAVEEWAAQHFSGMRTVTTTDSGHPAVVGVPYDAGTVQDALQQLADDGVLKRDRCAFLIEANNTSGMARGTRFSVTQKRVDDEFTSEVTIEKSDVHGLEGGVGDDFKEAWSGKYGLTLHSPNEHL